MSTTTTKICFLLLAAGALFCAGCATETAEQHDQIRQGAQQSGYGSGVILGPNGKTSTYFRNPGGGVILGSDGSITNVIGN
jgi:hypothetical protein